MFIFIDPIIRRSENMATSGWFIAMLLALLILIVLLIVVCVVKRNRGGKYVVHESEAARGRHDYPDEPHFLEYSQPYAYYVLNEYYSCKIKILSYLFKLYVFLDLVVLND